jgi:hypothetical protein
LRKASCEFLLINPHSSSTVLSLFAVLVGRNAFVAAADATGLVAAAAQASTTAAAN